MKNPAAGGGRWVDVVPARFTGWVDGFASRHGGIAEVTAGGGAVPGGGTAGGGAAPGGSPVPNGSTVPGGTVTFTAADGAIAECHPPFPAGLAAKLPGELREGAVTGAGAAAWQGAAAAIAAHAAAERTVGVLLVRLGGYAVGVFAGNDLIASKVGSRLVHGRSAAGGWSQHRFARRREKQASEALGAAADTAARILGARQLDAVVLGGDRRAIDGLRDDPRLAPYLARAEGRFLTVPDPKLPVLRDAPRLYTAIRVRVREDETSGS